MNLDYSDIRVVGIVEEQHNGNARICPIGYTNKNEFGYNFHPLNEDEIVDNFPSRGSIFAYQLISRYPDLAGKCIAIDIMPSISDGIDEYVWKRNKVFNEEIKPDEFAIVISFMANKLISGTANEIYDELVKEDYFNLDEKLYYYDQDAIFCLDPKDLDNRYIRFWNFSNLMNKSDQFLLIPETKSYIFFGEEIDKNSFYIDLMPDEELHNWLVNEFLIKEWAIIVKDPSNKILYKVLLDILSKSKWPRSIIKQRRKRILTMLERLIFTYNEIQDFMNFPGLAETIHRSVKSCGEKIIKELDSGFSEKIQQLKVDNDKEIKEAQEDLDFKLASLKKEYKDAESLYDTELEDVKSEINESKKNLALYAKSIEQKQQEIEKLNAQIRKIEGNKQHILDDFGVVKEVLQFASNANSKNVSGNITGGNNIEELRKEKEPFKTINDFRECLKHLLNQNGLKSDIGGKLLGYLVHYKVLLLPDNRFLLPIIQATGNCNYCIQYVTPDWRSFDDVWKNGLAELVEKCEENPDLLNYYVLENVNLTYLPCILQPIVDMSTGLLSVFPRTTKRFPKNLRILLTITEEEGLPLAVQSIRHFGCLKKVDYTLYEKNLQGVIPDKNIAGFLSLDLLESLSFAPILESDYISYVNGEDDE